jgi:hypothetical protein
MNGTDVLETLEEDFETEISRLGSSKALYAISSGDMDGDVVLGSLAARANETASIIAGWSETTDSDEASSLFDSIAAGVEEYAADLADLASEASGSGSTVFHEYLSSVESLPRQLGALLGWLVVSDQSYLQGVRFFVGSKHSESADLLRDIRGEIDEYQDDVITVIDSVCDEDEVDAVVAAASGLVEAAYDEYVESLESMGIDVKPIC